MKNYKIFLKLSLVLSVIALFIAITRYDYSMYLESARNDQLEDVAQNVATIIMFNSNSYIYDNNILQLKVDSQQLKFDSDQQKFNLTQASMLIPSFKIDSSAEYLDFDMKNNNVIFRNNVKLKINAFGQLQSDIIEIDYPNKMIKVRSDFTLQQKENFLSGSSAVIDLANNTLVIK